MKTINSTKLANGSQCPDQDSDAFVQAMGHLGADYSLISESVRKQLDAEGYAIFPQLLDQEKLLALRSRVDAQAAKEGSNGNHEAHCPEPGTARLADLVNKGEVFDSIWTHPIALAAVSHIISRPFKLSSLNYREPLRGAGHQGFHADWGPRVISEHFHVTNCVWMLDDVGPNNGGTRLVPRSHCIAGSVSDHVADTNGSHTGEITISAAAGSLLVFNSHCWHGGTTNRSGDRRRNLFAYYTAREHPQQTDQREFVRKSTWDRLTPAARWLLDV